jgi:hypothetical protein
MCDSRDPAAYYDNLCFSVGSFISVSALGCLQSKEGDFLHKLQNPMVLHHVCKSPFTILFYPESVELSPYFHIPFLKWQLFIPSFTELSVVCKKKVFEDTSYLE